MPADRGTEIVSEDTDDRYGRAIRPTKGKLGHGGVERVRRQCPGSRHRRACAA
jgi:hypothetical protein